MILFTTFGPRMSALGKIWFLLDHGKAGKVCCIKISLKCLPVLTALAYESYDYPSRPSSTLPVRNRLLINSPVEDFNNLHTEDDDDSDSERMSLHSGSDSSGTISVMSMQRPAVDVFVERFVDAFSPEVDMKSGRAGALRAAAGIRMFSPLITDAFEAVSVAFFGRSVQNKEIEASGFRLYPRVLRALQDALVDPEKSKAESTLVTVILLLAFEVRTTENAFSIQPRLTPAEC